ncbi:hypothetical protein [Xenorhabdus anantnagensis]|uniref:Uncharacterized protein n=1 Tax=Xenorhabdus anantnagensis TaxID=3025875 RepID=A0ABT5LT49_9GAMM|nr:hypothetical protein [Xenorhabdus anantnagensis]MDC9597582.1 hypothetical protein [Xenorhabdus anantnagensis]
MNNSNTNSVDSRSLQLKIDTPFLSVPHSYDSQSETIFTKVTAIVKSLDGAPLINTNIFISDENASNLKKVKILSSDKSKVDIKTKNGIDGFYITTGQKGELLFFIYPTKSKSLIMKLFSQLPESLNRIPADHIIFIVNDTIYNMKEDFSAPEIINLWGSYLKSDGKSEFPVEIEKSSNLTGENYILFFVNTMYTNHFIQITNASDIDTTFYLPYSIFEKDIVSNFFYVVVKKLGDILTSKSSSYTLTYKGRPNKPWTDVHRIYEPCVIYDSVDVSSDNIIQQMDYINTDEISNYRKNPDNAGLFVQIVGSNNPNDNQKVSLGSTIYLNLYINSSSKIVTHTFCHDMPYVPDDDDNTATLIFNIPHHFLINCLAYSDGGGDIYFDYQIGKDGDNNVTYGNIWHGFINTPDIE